MDTEVTLLHLAYTHAHDHSNVAAMAKDKLHK